MSVMSSSVQFSYSPSPSPAPRMRVSPVPLLLPFNPTKNQQLFLLNGNGNGNGNGQQQKKRKNKQQARPTLFCAHNSPSYYSAADEAVSVDHHHRQRHGLIKEEEKEEEEQQLPSRLRRELLPNHVAIIMDGNSRWATSKGLPTSAGHQAGYASLREIVTLSCKWGISALTVFAFSSENWRRPQMETDFLMMLFDSALKENRGDFLREGIRVRIIGDLSEIPTSLQKLAKEVEESTKNNSRFDLIVAISYSGRSDIVQACQRIAQKVRQGLIEPAEITESLVAQELQTNCIAKLSYPDLLIRTSGEMRLSNFLLWQSAYTELYFAKTYWPDFGEADYIEALSSFQSRQRRFGQRTV